MKKSSFFQRMRLRSDEGGYVLPFALFVLTMAVLFTSASLWVGESLEERVATRIDLLKAHDLVHEGVERVLFLLMGGKTVQTLSEVNETGSCDVACKLTAGTPVLWKIDAVALTKAGTKSTASIFFDPARQKVVRWSESP